jgi:hypothetical protein
MSVRILMAIALLLVQSQPALASSAGGAAAATVQGLVVKPRPKCLAAERAPAPEPKIVSIFPRNGQVVRPGLLVFRITFDRPMTCSGFLTALGKFANPCPPNRQTFVETFDHKTVRTLCLTQPGQTYGVVVGGDCSQPFLSLDDQQARPLAVLFRTSDGPPVTSAPEALAEEDAGPPPSDAASTDFAAARGLDGTWRGEITDRLGWRPLILRVRTDAKGTLTATLDSPYRNAFDLPVGRLRLDRNTVEFELPAVKDTYAGTLSVDGSTIRGAWAAKGKTTNFTYITGAKSCISLSRSVK